MRSTMPLRPDRPADAAFPPTGSAAEVFGVFLRLGLTSFGGPVAHLGYFREELVVRRRWIDEAAYADLVALCQFLPGPASSQVGYTLGLLRGGPLGALAAWCAFTLPSALLLALFAIGAARVTGPIAAGLVHGLKLTAVAIVAQAVWGMARSLGPDKRRGAIAFAALAVVVLVGGAAGQIAAIALGGLVGVSACRSDAVVVPNHLHLRVSRPLGFAALVLFAVLLVGLPLLSAVAGGHVVAMVAAFYRSGALVFGGGHVVLPLLQAAVVQPGWIGQDRFLAGYGATQAVPGPLFAFAAFLGAAMTPTPHGMAGALICLVVIFLPGLLLVTGALPFWTVLRARPAAQAAMRGASAAVVGVLGAALYDPVWTTAILGRGDFVVAAAGFLLLAVWKVRPWIVVSVTAIGGWALTLL